MADRKVTIDVDVNDGEAKKKLEALDRQVDQTADGLSGNLTISAQQAEQALAEAGAAAQKSQGVFGQTRTAVNQLAEANGFTFKSMGALGSATLVVSAAMAGWQIGRTIAEVTGLDKHVEKGWRNLLGYANSGLEAAANKTDLLARASQIAGREITNVTNAVKILAEELRRSANANIDWTQMMSDAQREVRNLSDATRNEIEIAQKAGASVQQLTDKYRVSALALSLLGDRKKLTTEMAAAHAAALDKEKAATAAYNVEIANQRVLFDNLNKSAAAAMAAKAKMQAGSDFIGAAGNLAAANKAEADRIAANQADIDRLLGRGGSTANGGSSNVVVNGVPVFDNGGIVNKPTLAMLAANGKREFVVPETGLSDFVGAAGGGNISVTVPGMRVDSDARMRQMVSEIADAVSQVRTSRRTAMTRN